MVDRHLGFGSSFGFIGSWKGLSCYRNALQVSFWKASQVQLLELEASQRVEIIRE